MKIPVILLGLLAVVPVTLPRLAAADAPASSLDRIAFIVGGVWRAELPAGADGTKKGIELRAEFSANHQAIRFDSAWLQGTKTIPYTSGIYAWNAARQKLVMWYTDASGNLTEGVISIEGDALVHELTTTSKEGKIAEARARITPHGANTYLSEIFVPKNGAWEKLIELQYVHEGGANN